MLFLFINLSQLLKDLFVKFVLDELSANESIRLDILIILYCNINALNFQRFFIKRLFFLNLLLIQGISFLKDSIYSEKYFPKYTFNKCGNNINNCNMHKTEEEHNEGIVIRCTPAVIKGDLWPSCLSQHHNHYVLRMNEACKVGELLILIVRRRTNCIIEIIKELHANNTIDVKEKEKKGHEPYNNG